MKTGYRGFLWQVENAMRITGFEDEQINSLFNRLKQLNPSEFHEYYRNNDLVKRLYEIVRRPVHGDMKLTTTEDDARDLIETLLEEVDQDIAEIKSK